MDSAILARDDRPVIGVYVNRSVTETIQSPSVDLTFACLLFGGSGVGVDVTWKLLSWSEPRRARPRHAATGSSFVAHHAPHHPNRTRPVHCFSLGSEP